MAKGCLARCGDPETFRNKLLLEYGVDNSSGIKNSLIKIYKDMDYYFFTDNETLKSDYWNVVLMPLQPNTDFVDSFRHTAKHSKFVVPKMLHKYDIIVWIDSSMLGILRFSKEKIIELFKTDKRIFLIKHPRRSIACQELKRTIELKAEHIENAETFLDEIKDMRFNTHLPATGCIVYAASNDNISLLRNAYDTLISKGLRRDQNVIQYVFLNNDYESKISYFKLTDLY